MRRLQLIGCATAVIVTAGSSLSAIAADNSFATHVDDQGNIHFLDGFRSSMAHLGSWFVPEGDASGFHDVYTEKTSVEAHRKNRKQF